MNKSYLQQAPTIMKEFLGYTETVKGRGEHTVDEYFIDLRTFFRYIKRQRGLVNDTVADDEIVINDIDLKFISDITRTDIVLYMSYLASERSNCSKTRARKATSLRMFFRYLTDYTHQLEHNPMLAISNPTLPKSKPKYLTLDQSKELLASVAQSGSDFPERDYCMLTFFLNCGLRRAELAGINLRDIRSDYTMRIRGKGNKERIVYLNAACREALEAYLRVRPVDGVKDREALFLSRLKKRISLQGIHYVVKNYLRNIEGAEDLSTHKLRHTAATMMYQYGHVDVLVLKDILGHENIGTTQIYTHLADSQVKEALDSNPLSEVSTPLNNSHNDNTN